jgi:glutaredoxin
VPATTLTLLGKPGCHLCDIARDIIVDALLDFPEVELVEHSILEDPALLERHRHDIPVVLIDGAVHTIHRVDSARLRAALAAGAP